MSCRLANSCGSRDNACYANMDLCQRLPQEAGAQVTYQSEADNADRGITHACKLRLGKCSCREGSLTLQ